MKTTRLVMAACGGALVVGAPVAAWADAAPPGTAEGAVAQVQTGGQGLVSVSQTSASATDGGGTASSSVLSLPGSNGQAPSSQLGGSAGPNQSTSGSLLDTGPSSSGELAVTPWSASNTSSGSSSTSQASAAVARGTLGSGSSSASASVLQSQSDATYNGSGAGSSSGSSSTDGAVLNVGGSGGLTVDVLHSDASTSGQGHTYLVGVNGNYIGTASDVGTVCKNLNIQGVAGLNCLTVSGGVGSMLAQVAGLNLGGSGGLLAGLFTSTAGSNGGGVQLASVSGNTLTAAATPAATSAAPAGTATPGGGTLPFTGAPIEFMVFAGVALLALGGATVAATRVVAPGLLA